MSEHFEPPPQQLQGYTLIDRLGAGGYGEVWRADAPGGLTKAVKYVYGRQDEARASSELKALERIKGVRHPFLLSLERIEVIDGRLIVVTELADGSLRDRYQACLNDGDSGIPREELLGYLRDAADALDFLNGAHDLQHLDIKPENLLLVAGHVKVADFGLVKSITNQTQSLVGGMTPTYAAPEVFQGQPSKHSDQYSLAVMFQELLTGVLPFPGSNVAELTLQHMNDEPDLSSLSEQDRYVLSRALAKDPEYRFDNCSEMVRAIAEGVSPDSPAATPTTARPHRPAVAPPSRSSYSATEVFEGDDDPGWSDSQAPILIDAPPPPNPGLRYTAAPAFDAEGFKPSPSLFIGIGGTAAKVLKTLRTRMTNRFGAEHKLPALPLLLLDTDAKSLTAATRGAERGEGLRRDETISLPLRRPQEYREKSTHLLKWLGRRWLYNVPRSLQTDGIRPLGRLALVDHARQAFQRIRRSLADCVSPESVAETQQQTGMEFSSKTLRVYLCASISGGAGGGMLLDVAYAVRSILQKLGIADVELIGVMTHSTSRDARRGELARVNAYSWLAEFNHLSQADAAYPGDESCGLPPHEPGTPPFDDAYLVDLGAGLDAIAFEDATQSVADYLYLDALTPSQRLLDACREESRTEADQPKLRTFAVTRCESAPANVLRSVENIAIQRLVAEWVGEDPTTVSCSADTVPVANKSTNPIVHGAAQVVANLKLDAAGLSSLCRSLIDARIGEGASDLATRWGQSSAGVSNWAEVMAPPESLLGGDSAGPDPHPPLGAAAIRELVAPLGEKLSADLSRWIVTRIDAPRERVSGARRAVEWFSHLLTSVEAELDRLARSNRDQANEWLTENASLDWTASGPAAIRAARIKRVRQLVDAQATDAAIGLVQSLHTAVAEAESQIDEAARTLAAILASPEVDGELNPSESVEDFDERLVTILSELKRRSEVELLPGGGDLTWLTEETVPELRSDLSRLAEQVVAREFSGAGLASESSVEGSGDWATPRLTELGASARRFVVQPADTNLDTPTGEDPAAQRTTVAGAPGETLWGVEAEGLSLPHVAVEIVDRRRDYATLGQRVYTRKDIEWSDLLRSLDAPATALAADSLPIDIACTEAIVS